MDTWPVANNSAEMIELIGADKPLRGNADMAFILVPPNQKKSDVKLSEYSRESDAGPYPSNSLLRARHTGLIVEAE